MARFLPLVIALAVFISVLVFKPQLYVLSRNLLLANSTVKNELTSQRYLSEILQSSGKFEPDLTSAVWFNKPVTPPGKSLARMIVEEPTNILGQSTGDKWIEVNLTTQHLYAHDGDRVVFDFPISSGLPWFPTVTGEFHIWAKIRSQRMTGGSVENGTFYDLPNVPFVQYFHMGYGLHGTYWHNDFGKPRSHGCVNISIPNSEKLFYWTDPQLAPNEYSRTNINPDESTRVVVHGTTPANIN